MKENKNQVLSSKHAVAAGDVFCSYLQQALRKPDNMTLKAFKTCFKVLFKLYDDLKTEYELMIGEKEHHLIFLNSFSADHQNKFFQQQKNYHRMMMDEIVTFFQVCHATDQPLHDQHQYEIAAKKERKEANQERGAANKKQAASRRNNSLSTGNDKLDIHGCPKNLCCNCKPDGYNVTWTSCSRHNF